MNLWSKFNGYPPFSSSICTVGKQHKWYHTSFYADQLKFIPVWTSRWLSPGKETLQATPGNSSATNEKTANFKHILYLTF